MVRITVKILENGIHKYEDYICEEYNIRSGTINLINVYEYDKGYLDFQEVPEWLRNNYTRISSFRMFSDLTAYNYYDVSPMISFVIDTNLFKIVDLCKEEENNIKSRIKEIAKQKQIEYLKIRENTLKTQYEEEMKVKCGIGEPAIKNPLSFGEYTYSKENLKSIIKFLKKKIKDPDIDNKVPKSFKLIIEG